MSSVLAITELCLLFAISKRSLKVNMEKYSLMFNLLSSNEKFAEKLQAYTFAFCWKSWLHLRVGGEKQTITRLRIRAGNNYARVSINHLNHFNSAGDTLPERNMKRSSSQFGQPWNPIFHFHVFSYAKLSRVLIEFVSIYGLRNSPQPWDPKSSREFPETFYFKFINKCSR